MNEKIEVINEMVKLGYNLMNRTAEEMAKMFSLEDLKNFLENFKNWKTK